MTNKPKILIVDDDQGWLDEVVHLLSSEDYDIDKASSFKTARKKLGSTRYAAIIIDLELEESEGPRTFEGFGLLSGNQFLESLPQGQGKAIVFSAYGTSKLVRQAFKHGAYDFMFKQDFDEDKFLAVVRDAVELWRSRGIVGSELQLRPEQEEEYERFVHQFRQSKGVQSFRDLRPVEEKEFRELARRFMRGESITFDVPDDAVNPWAREADPARQD